MRHEAREAFRVSVFGQEPRSENEMHRPHRDTLKRKVVSVCGIHKVTGRRAEKPSPAKHLREAYAHLKVLAASKLYLPEP